MLDNVKKCQQSNITGEIADTKPYLQPQIATKNASAISEVSDISTKFEVDL